jgi:acetolactate synthase-1/2/3 large subunit
MGTARSGGQIIVDELLAHGVTTAFGVPGESYLPVLDAMYDSNPSFTFVTCRHEAGAATMAEATGKLTGKPGICLVTRGPGATHASVGVHNAAQDSSPMILFVGEPPNRARHRDTFQELNLEQTFGDLAKWVVSIRDTERLPELISRAFRVATGGRPGPVVIGLPEDMLFGEAEAETVVATPVARPCPTGEQVAAVTALLAEAERPIAIVGGPGWSQGAADGLKKFAEAWQLPVANAFRRQDAFDNASDCYVGDLGVQMNPGLAERITSADVVLAIGCRLDAITTAGYRLLEPPRPRQRLVHVHVGDEELGRVYQPELAIHADIQAFCDELSTADAPAAPRWADRAAAARAGYRDWAAVENQGEAARLAEFLTVIYRKLPADALIASGAGNYAVSVHRNSSFGSYPAQVAPTSGSMGYGLPAAIAAKAAFPERTSVAFAGDGCFLMSGNELATAVQHDLPVLVVVINNSMYGTIRGHQEKKYPGRVVGTSLVNPDFAQYARSFGCVGEVVNTVEELTEQLDQFLAGDRPTLLEIRV